MKYLIFLLGIGLISCKPSPKTAYKTNGFDSITNPKIDSLLQSNGVKGAVLVFNPADSQFICNNYDWATEKRLPASTFKIVNSIIGLETWVINEDSIQFKWNGEKRRLAQWEQDMDVKKAFMLSCVPCYQQLARSVGLERMNTMLKKLKYGDRTIDSAMLDLFWLEGDFGVSCFDQLDFLYRLDKRQLDIRSSTYESMKRIMLIDSNQHYSLYGKTGLSWSNGMNNGWFVGYIKTADHTYYVATNLSPINEVDYNEFIALRLKITLDALQILELIH